MLRSHAVPEQWPTFKYVDTPHFMVGRVPGTRILSWTAKPEVGPGASLTAALADLESELSRLDRGEHDLLVDLRAAGSAPYVDEFVDEHLRRIARGFRRVAVLVDERMSSPRDVAPALAGADEHCIGTDENEMFRWLRRPRRP